MRNGKEGYLIIDPSNGFFPLVQDPNSRREFKGKANNTRESGFKAALNKLQKNHVKVFEILNKHDEWSHELEAELEKWFEYPKEKSAANDSNFGSDIRRTG